MEKQELIKELEFTVKALKTIVSNFHMEPMARSLMDTRIIELERKIDLFKNQIHLEELKHAS